MGKLLRAPAHCAGGLALGNSALRERVRSLVRGKGTREELKWVSKAERADQRAAAAEALASEQPERRWQLWVRVQLGGECRVDVARAFRYKDGSAITQNLKRLRNEMQPSGPPAARSIPTGNRDR